MTRRYGAYDMPRTIVLDPLLAVANIAWDHPDGHAAGVRNVLTSLPDVDGSAGVPLTAPALIVPRVFEFPFCELLVKFYEEIGGADSGFLVDRDGKPQPSSTIATSVGRSRHRRAEPAQRHPRADRAAPGARRSRVLPVQCDPHGSLYGELLRQRGGRAFFAHRDNVNAGARHRRFAASINLNGDYDGCDLIFPEFGRRMYKAPVGGAIVFSCGALHQVTPVTRGKRYAFVPFFYGEEDAAMREANNVHLKYGEIPYTGERDRLFPAADAPGIVPEMAEDAVDEPATPA